MSIGSPTAIADLRGRGFRRILMVKPSSLGDLIHALPVLRALRQAFPQAYIAWLVADSFAPLLTDHPDLDDVIVFNRRRLMGRDRSAKRTDSVARLLHSLCSYEFDLAIDLQGLFRSGIMTLATGADVRIGFADAREAAWLFYTHRIDSPQRDIHAVDKNLLAMTALGIAVDAPGPILTLSDAERSRAVDLLRAVGLDPAAPFLAALPGARWETKRWPADRFAAVIDRVWERHQLPTVVLGTPAERDVCDTVIRAARVTPFDLVGQTGIRDLVAVLDRASVVLTHDSAPMHMAAALGRPLVAVHGPTNPNRTGPYGLRSAVVQADLPCVPCYFRKLSQCPIDQRCMKEVTVGDIVDRITHCLRPAPGGSKSRQDGADAACSGR